MRALNLSNIKAQVEGDFPTLAPGAYVCQITDVEDFESKEYLRVLVDIMLGEHEGYFAGDFYKDKPWAHSIMLSYKESALGMLKGRLETISACNTGFDAVAAIEGGRYDMLKGKVVGVVFREEEYYDKKADEFKLGSARPDRLCTTQDIQDGKNANPAPKMLKDADKRAALDRAGIDPDRWFADKERQKAIPAEVRAMAATATDTDLPF